MDSQTPNQSRVGATHTNRLNGGGNAMLTLAPGGASKHQSGHVEIFNMHRSVHISKEIFLCSRRCGSDSSKKERTRCHRQSAPYRRDLTRSATNVAHRALVTSISKPSGEEKEHAVHDLSRRDCPAGNQISTRHSTSTTRRKRLCGPVGR